MPLPNEIARQREQEKKLANYEGLIFTTASLIAQAGVEVEFQDVQQILRIKAWKAVRAFDPQRSRGLTLDRYVFMCVFDERKTIEKKKRHYEAHIEDFVIPGDSEGQGAGLSDSFTERYLCQDEDDAFGDVLDEVTLPSAITDEERWVLVLMYRDYKQVEIAAALAVPKREIERRVRSLRQKLGPLRSRILGDEGDDLADAA